MKILVVGSEGFIGQHLVKHFSGRQFQILTADIVSSEQSQHTMLDSTAADFDAIFAKSHFDLCINASGSANVQFSFENPAIDFALNVSNVQKMLEAIRQFQPSCRFMNFSS